jgi:hypothetical protein
LRLVDRTSLVEYVEHFEVLTILKQHRGGFRAIRISAIRPELADVNHRVKLAVLRKG